MNKSKQQGVVLLVSLVILLVVTLLGTVAMQGTGLEFKMAKNTSERQQVFQAVEAALRRAEQGLDDNPYSRDDLDSSICSAGTSTCFEATCSGGLCFFGTNDQAEQEKCEPVSGTIATQPVWFDSTLNVWQNSSLHQSVTIDSIDVQYIIEFRCFVDSVSGSVSDAPNGAGDAFYRITALGTNSTGRLQVMLQSTYSVPPAS